MHKKHPLYQKKLQRAIGSGFSLAGWSSCHHHDWGLLRLCRWALVHLARNVHWFSFTFSGLLISGLYIESGPTVQNILVVHISVGGLVGLGFGLMYLPAMDIVPHYFDHRCLFKALSRAAKHSTNFLLQTWTGDWHCCSRLWCRPGSLLDNII